MRDEVLEAVAVAHFRILRDGRVIVSLAKPTNFSRLNDVILDTLREWRFHPAMNQGVAVDSEAEVRLLITVQ
jgi:protein TonB